MKRTCLIAFVILFTGAAGWAQDLMTRSHRPLDSRYSATNAYPSAAWSRETRGRATHNANDCAPDTPEPVWGADSSLVGYSCVPPSANGN